MTILARAVESQHNLPDRPARAARRIEGIFWQILARELRRAIPKDGLLGEGLSGKMFADLLDQSIADQAAGSVELGLSKSLLAQLGVPPANSSRMSANPAPIFPQNGRITSGYGLRRDPFTGSMRFHHGLDIGAPEGTPIQSLTGGLVIHSGPAGGLGNRVTIRTNDGTTVTYGHCRSVEVQVGKRVSPGNILGEVGHTGRATGPHLHLEIRAGGKSRDPLKWLAESAHAG